MRFLILRVLTHSELGMFHEYRRQGKEGSKQRAVNFDWDVVDRVFPAAKDTEKIDIEMRYQTDTGVAERPHWLKRQEKNWRLEGNCPRDKCYAFVDPGCLFAMEVDASTSPATGAWAVFPEDDEVARSILAHGDSSRLASSAMIALHGDEGEHAWRTLAKARPDLFLLGKGVIESGGATTANGSGKGMELAPNPKRLVRILAAVGHTMHSAVADLVDNSINAKATEIAITFGPPNGGHGRWMSIADNGEGMDAPGLAEAMRIGSDASYEANSLGKYGYGLKGASWSQTDVFTVVTRKAGGPLAWMTWDANEMDDWIPSTDPLETWEQDATAIPDHGTVVLWKSMRPPQTMPTIKGLDPHSAEVMELERHLALVFHRFLEGTAAGRRPVTITINGRKVEPNNPVGHPLASPYDMKSIRVPTGTGDGRVQIQAFLLPSEDEIKAHHAAQGQEAVDRAIDLIGLHGKRNETQGLFIYRNDRLIKWGGWHQMWSTNDEKTKLARVVVNYDTVLDDSFKINISKQLVQLPSQLQAEIKLIAEVARKDSQKKYRKSASGSPAGGSGSAHAGNGHGAPVPRTTPPVPGQAPGSGATGAAPAGGEPPPRIAVRPVATRKFLWKVSTGLAGGRDVQVSDAAPSLAALAKRIAGDPDALADLADFLDSLDRIGVQQSLLGRTGD
ncbi:ATP-binding protein [Rhodovastum atsumiense]|uniref:ATP-binding protein n=2 Tax=Rhodovastum atsumiense TaxID=504468 RepID=A0A5M6IUA2_9PROT|nr:ATP-binding protein [Rhodovastum atsumiense]